jgi:hypothetical protein
MRVYCVTFYHVLFAVRFRAFAVRQGRTANPPFPVVSKGKAESENTYVFMASFSFVIFLIFFLSFFVS